eukprot:1190805-Prorocentrum_minimum.AAC.4
MLRHAVRGTLCKCVTSEIDDTHAALLVWLLLRLQSGTSAESAYTPIVLSDSSGTKGPTGTTGYSDYGATSSAASNLAVKWLP